MVFNKKHRDQHERKLGQFDDQLRQPGLLVTPAFWKVAEPEDVSAALDGGCNLFSPSKSGVYPVHVAAAHAQSETFQKLVDACLDYEKPIGRPNDPKWASGLRMNHNRADNSFKTPLQMAARNGRTENCRVLLNSKVSGSFGLLDELCAAIWSGKLETVKVFNEADVNGHIGAPYHDPIHIACAQGNRTILRYLLDLGNV